MGMKTSDREEPLGGHCVDVRYENDLFSATRDFEC